GGSRDGLLLELDLAGGGTVRAERWGGPLEETGLVVATSATGGIALGGSFEGTADVFGKAVQSAGASEALVVVLDGEHRATWAARYGDSSADELRAVSWDTLETLVVGGRFSKTIDLATPPLQSQGDQDVFLARLKP